MGKICSRLRILCQYGSSWGGVLLINDWSKFNRRIVAEKSLQSGLDIINIASDKILHGIHLDTAAYNQIDCAVGLDYGAWSRILFKDCTLVTRKFGIAQRDFWIKLLDLHIEQRVGQSFSHHIRHHDLFFAMDGIEKYSKTDGYHHKESQQHGQKKHPSALAKVFQQITKGGSKLTLLFCFLCRINGFNSLFGKIVFLVFNSFVAHLIILLFLQTFFYWFLRQLYSRTEPIKFRLPFIKDL